MQLEHFCLLHLAIDWRKQGHGVFLNLGRFASFRSPSLPGLARRPPGDSDSEQTHIHCRLLPVAPWHCQDSLETISSKSEIEPLFTVRDLGLLT